MDILQFNELDPTPVAAQFDRVVAHLRAGDFRGAEVRKLAPTPYYRAKLNAADRLLFRLATCRGRRYILLIEIIRNHAYATSRFLRGATVDEEKPVPLPDPAGVPEHETLPLGYVNPARRDFHLLDKVLSFDEAQAEAFGLRPPCILIGTAGSGKTVLSLERLKRLPGDSNQIVHPNFFAWANIKTLFYHTHAEGRPEILRVLDTNYRNAPPVIALANRLLRIKQARFGSILSRAPPAPSTKSRRASPRRRWGAPSGMPGPRTNPTSRSTPSSSTSTRSMWRSRGPSRTWYSSSRPPPTGSCPCAASPRPARGRT